MINILLCNLLIVISLRMFCQGLMSRRYHHVPHEILLYVFLCVSSYCGYVWLRIFVVLIGCCWYVASKYVDTKGFQMLVLCVYFVCLSMSEWICASVFHEVDGLGMHDYGTGLYTMLLCFAFMMVCILLNMVYQLLYAYKKKYWLKHVWMVCVLPISSIVLFLNMKDLFSMFVYDGLVIIALVGVFVSNIFVLYLYQQVVELYMMKEAYAKLEDTYHSLHDLYASNCVFLHEVTRKVFQIKNQSDDTLRFGVDDLCSVLFQQFYNTHTDCACLRKVLMKYQKELGEWQIEVHSDMQVWHSSFCEEMFEYLVEYGISLCKSVEGLRSMMFSSYEYHNTVVLKYAVSCDENAMCDVKIPFSKMYSKKIVDGFYEMSFVFERGSV